MTNSQHSAIDNLLAEARQVGALAHLFLVSVKFNQAEQQFLNTIKDTGYLAYLAGARSTKEEFAKEIKEELISIIRENAPYVDIINNVGEFAERLGGKENE